MGFRAGKLFLGAALLVVMTALPAPVRSAEPPANLSSGVAASSASATPEGGSVSAPDWMTLTRKGYRQLDTGDLDGATASFDRALAQQPLAHAAKTGKGIVLARKGDLKGAARVLREALVLNPDPVRAHYELGRVYQRLGDFDRAVTEFKAGLEKFREGRK